MARGNLRVRVDAEGRLEVIDPSFDSVPLLKSIDPGFRLHRSPLLGFTSPRFLQLRERGCGLFQESLASLPEDWLWERHAAVMTRLREGRPLPIKSPEQASVLDLKIAIAGRNLSNCRLCGHRCGVDRSGGEYGKCLLGSEALVADHFVHIAEESPLNPSLLIGLVGCGLSCRFCQQGELLDPAGVGGERLAPSLWSNLSFKGARSLSFIGGNPDESLYAVLCFLAAAPSNWRLPVVWNSNAYGSPETLRLLEGVADAYVPDFKYGNEACGQALSKAPDYPAIAKNAISTMLSQHVPVIVRILVLPGHLECCHVPVIDALAHLNSEYLFVSVRGQYYPDWQITEADGPLARRPTQEEILAIRDRARCAGLTLID